MTAEGHYVVHERMIESMLLKQPAQRFSSTAQIAERTKLDGEIVASALASLARRGRVEQRGRVYRIAQET